MRRCFSTYEVIDLIPAWLGFAELQYVDGFRKVPGAPGAAGWLGEDLPGLELCVCALAGGAGFRVGAVGLLVGLGLVPLFVRDLRRGAAVVALVLEGDGAGFVRFVRLAQAGSGFLSWTVPGGAPGTRGVFRCGDAMTCRFMPCSASSLAGGFLAPGSGTPHLRQIVTNPLQAGWKSASGSQRDRGVSALDRFCKSRASFSERTVMRRAEQLRNGCGLG
jgi:hypothetical protein